MYVCIYIYIYIHMCVCIYIYIYIYNIISHGGLNHRREAGDVVRQPGAGLGSELVSVSFC